MRRHTVAFSALLLAATCFCSPRAEAPGLALGWQNWRPQGEAKPLEIVLGPAKALTGRVVDEKDQPVAGAEVAIAYAVVRRKDQQQYPTSAAAKDALNAKTGADGKFAFTNLPAAATVEFTVSAAGHGTVDTFQPELRRDGSLQYTPGQEDIKITLRPAATIKGVVVDKANGQPLAGVALMVVRSRTNAPRLSTAPILSGADGAFAVENLAEGDYTLSLPSTSGEALPEWVAPRVSVHADAGTTTDKVRIEATKGGILEVTVTDAATKAPMAGATVYAQGGDSQGASRTTDATGKAQLRLFPGQYQVQAYKDGYRRPEPGNAVEVEVPTG